MSEPNEQELIKQQKYDRELQETLSRESQETERIAERQRKYTQEDVNRLREQAEQGQQGQQDQGDNE